jgi:hypothetical protein
MRDHKNTGLWRPDATPVDSGPIPAMVTQARGKYLDYDIALDCLGDITPKMMKYVENVSTRSLRTQVDQVRKVIYLDLAIYFLWGTGRMVAKTLQEDFDAVFGPTIPKRERANSVTAWIIGMRSPTDEEFRAQCQRWQ